MAGGLPIYRIRAWDTTFETAQSRRVETLRWMPIPIDHDGDGYTELTEMKDAASHYGCWIATATVAARCNPRGVLIRRDGRPHTPQTIARITRLGVRAMRSAWEAFISLGWLELDSRYETSPSTLLDGSIDLQASGEERRGEESKRDDRLDGDPLGLETGNGKKPKKPWTPEDVEAIYQAYPRKVGKQVALTAIEKALRTIHAEGLDDPAMTPQEWLLGVVRVYAASPRGRGDVKSQPDYRPPHPSTWFNQARYDDDQKEWSR